MDKYRKELLSVPNHAKFEEEVKKSKSASLHSKMTAGSIYACSNPSNLVEPLRQGEKYAPDSCVYEGELKYVWAGQLIDTSVTPFDLKSALKAERVEYRPPEMTEPDLVIPSLIVRNRPGISLPVLKSEPFIPPSSQPDMRKVQEEAKTLKRPKFKARMVKKEEEKLKPSQSKTLSQRSKKPILKKKKKKVCKVPDVELSESAAPKTVTWGESKEDLKDTETVSLEAKYRAEATEEQKIEEKHRVPRYLNEAKHPPEKSLEDLEKLVEEQQKYLQEQGMSSRLSSSSEKYHKTYEELEKEIKQIKMMLTDKEEAHEERESPEHLEYSPDEAPEEASFEEWLSPRFHDSPKY